MSQLNVKEKQPAVFTHEGGRAVRTNQEAALRRAVMACMLWEDQFYESGIEIGKRILDLVPQVDATAVMNIAIEARHQMKLRHAPLLLASAMAKLPDHKKLLAHTLEAIVDRPDEITEFLAIHAKLNGVPPDKVKKTISAQIKKGLAAAFRKFNEYSLAKYNRDGAIKLRDALFLVHAKPSDAPERQYTRLERREELVKGEQKMRRRKRALTQGEELYRKLVDDELATPDTWEVALSGGADKKETFERLIEEKKLGALALLRNLRNMEQVGVAKAVVAGALASMNTERVLPFRFIAAARVVPQWEDVIEPSMLKCLEGAEKIPGKTILLLDVSGSMDEKISAKSDLRRVDAACGLAILVRELCEEVDIHTFSNSVIRVPSRRGFALRDAIVKSQPHSGTYLGKAVEALAGVARDRIIVITDEQAHDSVPNPHGLGYVINVASYKNGVGYGAWTHIDGWSEAVIAYIREFEQSND